MIKSWWLENFKCVSKRREFEFSPLTIFCGSNSSGKSTVLQSLLLVSQTVASPVGPGAVELNGRLFQFGDFEDILCDFVEEESIAIGWKIADPQEHNLQSSIPFFGQKYVDVSTIEGSFEFTTKLGKRKDSRLSLAPALVRSQFSGTSSTGEEYYISIVRECNTKREIDSKVSYLFEANKQFVINQSELAYKVELDPISDSKFLQGNIDRNLVGAELQHFLPVSIRAKVNAVERYIDSLSREIREIFRGREMSYWSSYPLHQIVIKHISKADADLAKTIREELENSGKDYCSLDVLYKAAQKLPKRKRFAIRKYFYDKLDVLRGDILSALSPIYQAEAFGLPGVIGHVVETTRGYFSNCIKYLGPLRDEPRSLYPLASSSGLYDIGLRGEHTAAVLYQQQNKLVRFLRPESLSGNQLQNLEESKVTLLESVEAWLKYFQLGSACEPNDKGKLGHELKIKTAKSKGRYDLSHVGVGVSQVLPILVLGLLSSPNDILVIEQPELHLHPFVQTRLGDFFLFLSLTGRQCIIESHSEYLISRLRRRVASDNSDRLRELIQIYFVERDGRETRFQSLSVNKYGVLSEWPRGFFDQSEFEAEAILRAGLEKRKKERTESNSRD